MKNIKNQKGFSLVELLVVVIIIAIIAAIAIPNLLASRRAANEASAASSLRTIHSAQMSYYASQSPNIYGDLAALSGAGLLDDTFTGPSFVKSGYTISESVTAVNTTGYCALAVPTAGNGTRTFGVTEDGVIYAGVGGTAPACAIGVFTRNAAPAL